MTALALVRARRPSASKVPEIGEPVTNRWDWLEAVRLYAPAKPGLRAVLFALALRTKKHHDDRPTCFPGMGTIAQDAGMSRRNAIDCMNEARRLGWIKTLTRGRPKRGGNLANVYTLAVPPGFEEIERKHSWNLPRW